MPFPLHGLKRLTKKEKITRSTMASSDVKLLSAKWVVPGEGTGRVLEDHTVVVRGSEIVEVIPSADCAAKYPGNKLVYVLN